MIIVKANDNPADKLLDQSITNLPNEARLLHGLPASLGSISILLLINARYTRE